MSRNPIYTRKQMLSFPACTENNLHFSLIFMNFNYIMSKCIKNKINSTFIRLLTSKTESVNYLIPV